MEYEFRVWNNPTKDLSSISPESAKSWLKATADSVAAALGNNNHGNPDILIDTKTLGEGTVALADISYNNEKLKAQDDNTKRAIKMHIKGNLYLPLEGSLKDAAKAAVGVGNGEASLKAKRNTLLLSQWAAVKPDSNEANKPYYRSVALSITTKAGDFRVITANNMYVESYSEDYSEGEFGSFELTLKQSLEGNANFKVDGLASEKLTVIDKIGKAIDKAADVASKIATTAAVAGAIVATTTETVEKFTGETEATRKIKGVSKATASAGKVVKDTGELAKNARAKDFDKINESAKNLSDSSNELVRTSKSAHGNKALSLSKMEEEYLDWIKANPKEYEKYVTASDSEKRKMLEQAAKEKEDRWYVTKYYEESSINMDKVKEVEKNLEKESDARAKANKENKDFDIQDLNFNDEEEKVEANRDAAKNETEKAKLEAELAALAAAYLAYINKDSKKKAAYDKATTAEKIEMLNAVKKKTEDAEKVAALEKDHLDAIKKDAEKYKKYQKASNEEKIEMLQAEQKKVDNAKRVSELEKNYLDTIKKDSANYEKYKKLSDEEKIKVLEELQDAAEESEMLEKAKNPPTNSSLSSADLNNRINSAANKKNGNS